MMSRFELGRIAGIPVFLDMMFVLVLLFFTLPYFTSGDSQLVSAGVVILIGLMLSVLLHELGHALAGRLFNAHVSHIDLTGIGGVAHFERSLPSSVLARTVIFLAGPAVNMGLWLGLGYLAVEAIDSGKAMLGRPLFSLASANFYLLCFNLLPAYPLDGGHTLDAWLGKPFGSLRAARAVAILGVVIAVLLAVSGITSGDLWRVLLAFFLYQANWEALQSAGGWNGR